MILKETGELAYQLGYNVSGASTVGGGGEWTQLLSKVAQGRISLIPNHTISCAF